MSQQTTHRFEVDVRRGPAGFATVEAGERPPITGGPPPEFGGVADVWSPEHLLVGAAALCFETTFAWFARRDGLVVHAFRCRGEGDVEKTPMGLAFTGVRLDVDVEVADGEAARARDLVTRAKRACLVSTSLVCIVDVTAHVREATVAPSPPPPA